MAATAWAAAPSRKEFLPGLTSLPSFEDGLRLLICLNLFDALSTLGWIYGGLALEANPIMAQAIHHGPGYFILSKLALVGLSTTLLWRNRDRLSARLGLIPMAVLYAYVAGGHVGFALGNVLDVVPPVV